MTINNFSKEQIENTYKIKELLKNRDKESIKKIIELLNNNSKINKEKSLKNDSNISNTIKKQSNYRTRYSTRG